MTDFKPETDALIIALPVDWEGTDAEQVQRLIEAALRRVFAKARRMALTDALEDLYDLELSPDDKASDDGSSPQDGDGTTWNKAIRAAFRQIMALRDKETR